MVVYFYNTDSGERWQDEGESLAELLADPHFIAELKAGEPIRVYVEPHDRQNRPRRHQWHRHDELTNYTDEQPKPRPVF